jgi:hypothetical protein
MEILWPALGIAVIVIFVFYVLAHYWQRLLRQQSWTIRRLSDRVQSLEDMADPEWRRKLGEATPVPLERAFSFSFRLGDRFWRDAVHLNEDDQKYVRECGNFVGAVKLERWRSHTVATIAEVQPDSKATGWRTRELDIYSDPFKGGDAISLWELALAPPGLSAERPPSLELRLRANSLELRGRLLSAAQRTSGNGREAGTEDGEVIFFRVPLDTARLAEFRSQDPAATADNGGNQSVNGDSWRTFYFHQDDDLDIEWQLRSCDLTRKSDWERWKILESAAMPMAARE